MLAGRESRRCSFHITDLPEADPESFDMHLRRCKLLYQFSAPRTSAKGTHAAKTAVGSAPPKTECPTAGQVVLTMTTVLGTDSNNFSHDS